MALFNVRSLSKLKTSSPETLRKSISKNAKGPKKEKKMSREARARLFLEENISQLPSTHDQLKNGHLQLLYHGGDNSPAQTVKAIQEMLHCTLGAHHIRHLAKKVQKYEHHLTRQSDMDSYTKICFEDFVKFTAVLDMPDVQADVVMSEDPSPTTPSIEFSHQARSLPSITDVVPSPALGPFELNNGQPPHGVDMNDDPSRPSTGDVGPTDLDNALHTSDVQSTSIESPATLMKTT
ncbi:uncharacterized protein LOC123976639 isoform X2 [Micropterus dolomieu]|uniref:uncharacterized protein LOC123976639 isoform X2 n=1 Tax=Micropterus dolomieu TaxID=147949 RepID=UPI001E8DC07B|nr:uncharacterized protein LOC123976639 isoform X2 [Micropterus dolomieu]